MPVYTKGKPLESVKVASYAVAARQLDRNVILAFRPFDCSRIGCILIERVSFAVGLRLGLRLLALSPDGL